MVRLDTEVVDARVLAMATPILEDYLRVAGRARVDWFSVTIGPIGRGSSPIRVAASPNRRRGAAPHGRTVPTWPEHGMHVGYSISLFCLPEPSHAARRLELPAETATALGLGRLWVVYGVAWKRPDGPWAEWRADPAPGTAPLTYCFPGVLPSAEDLAELGRCSDLLLGRGARVGRRSHHHDRTWRPIAERAEALKQQHPDVRYRDIAGRLGVDERTLRRYRVELRREREVGDPAAPAVLATVELPSAPGRRPEPDLARARAV